VRTVLALAALLAGCAAAPEEPPLPRFAFPNAGFEQGGGPGSDCPRPWYCVVHAGATDAFRFYFDDKRPPEGNRAFCMERLTDEPWAYVSQSIPAERLRGATVRFSIAVRAEGLTGPGAGPLLAVHAFQQHPVDRQGLHLLATQGWQRYQLEARLPPDARLLEVGLQLEGGGRVCIDDARLEILSPGGAPL
jgi:hypothetical protein